MWRRVPRSFRWLGHESGAGWMIALLIAAATVPATLIAQTDSASPPAATAPEPEQPVAESAQAASAGSVHPFANDYLELCAGCHTIGGGELSGPDLLPSTTWAREDLRVAVKRMEKNVGPMTDEQVDGITDLLLGPGPQAQLDAAGEEKVQEMAATLEPGDPRTGRSLFFGVRRLTNGGVGCYACHAVAGRGGNMAVDLTMAHQRLGAQSLMSATERPAFPMMVAAYGSKPVTSQEAAHLAAFLEATAAATPAAQAAQPPQEALGLLHAGAGGIVLFVVAGVALLARSRRAGVRARMVRDSFRR